MPEIESAWSNKTIRNETLVLIDDGNNISGNLIYKPTKIISIKDYTLTKEYGKDEYEVQGNKIIRTTNSTMPYFTLEQLNGKNLDPNYALSTYQAKEPGTEIVFTEGVGIVMHQIAVTYEHNDEWTGKKPVPHPTAFNNVKTKLNNKEEVNVVVNGDSIFTGANASSKLGIAPFLEDFPTLFTNYLKEKYETEVNLINTSVGGMLSDFGKDNVMANVNAHNPDLVIIGYGMNDGSFGVAPGKYIENIEFMIRSIRANNPNADIMIVSTILPNPLSIQNKNQKDYLKPMEELSEQYNVALVDMTSISETLYKTKRGVDILANNINHPSDFLVRIYAAALITVFGD